jgi:hypothetical protein
VVGEAPAVLAGARGRVAAAAALVALLLAYWSTAMRFPDLPDWGDIAWTGIVVGAPLFALPWLALPLWRRGWPFLAAATVACAAAAVLAAWAGQAGLANLAKLAAATCAGFLFLSFFAEPSWLVLIALVVPIADTLSVWRGPTHVILTQRPGLFEADSVDFPPPGERVVRLRWQAVQGAKTYEVVAQRPGHSKRFAVGDERELDLLTNAHGRYRFVVRGLAGERVAGSAVARYGPACGSDPSCSVTVRRKGLELRVAARAAADRLGLTDVLFFARFLGGAARFGLRPGWTWLGLLAGFALTGAFSALDPFGIGGAPALPLIALGFLVPNVDRLWALRHRRDADA